MGDYVTKMVKKVPDLFFEKFIQNCWHEKMIGNQSQWILATPLIQFDFEWYFLWKFLCVKSFVSNYDHCQFFTGTTKSNDSNVEKCNWK